jgi:hypothetical protein
MRSTAMRNDRVLFAVAPISCSLEFLGVIGLPNARLLSQTPDTLVSCSGEYHWSKGHKSPVPERFLPRASS